MTDQPVPDQPDGINPDDHELPRAENAARRVGEFLEWFGDGIVEIGSPTPTQPAAPLYARDLQALINAWHAVNDASERERATRAREAENEAGKFKRLQDEIEALRAGWRESDQQQARYVELLLWLHAEARWLAYDLRRRLTESQLDVMSRGREIERLHKVVEFEAKTDRNEFWNVASSRNNLTHPLCACATKEQLAGLRAANEANPNGPHWRTPQCSVHTDGDGLDKVVDESGVFSHNRGDFVPDGALMDESDDVTENPGRCPACGGPAGENVFDREICPEPCGEMHTRCKACGTALGGCPVEASGVLPEGGTRDE